MKKILLRDAVTQLYVAKNETWVTDAHEAMCFDDSLDAFAYGLARSLQKVDVVVTSEENRAPEVVTPIQEELLRQQRTSRVV